MIRLHHLQLLIFLLAVQCQKSLYIFIILTTSVAFRRPQRCVHLRDNVSGQVGQRLKIRAQCELQEYVVVNVVVVVLHFNFQLVGSR